MWSVSRAVNSKLVGRSTLRIWYVCLAFTTRNDMIDLNYVSDRSEGGIELGKQSRFTLGQ